MVSGPNPEMRVCSGKTGKIQTDPMRSIKHRWRYQMGRNGTWCHLLPCGILQNEAEALLHTMKPHWTCLPNTAPTEVPEKNHWEVLWTKHAIILRADVGKSALRVIKGLPCLVTRCWPSYYSALEGKLTRTLNHIICRCLFWSLLLLRLCDWQLVSFSSSSSSGQRAEDEYRVLHWEMR